MRLRDSKKKRTRKRSMLVSICVLGAVCWVLFISLWMYSILDNGRKQQREKQQLDHHISAVTEENEKTRPVKQNKEDTEISSEIETSIWPGNRQFTNKDFDRTIKSCDNTNRNKCQQNLVDGKKQRIAILSPPGNIARLVSDWIIDRVQIYTTIIDNNDNTEIEILPSSHTPVYGYGRSHGYTKIIRLASLPLILGVADFISSREEKLDGLSSEDVKSIMQQLVRWHCRLSAVAAHTSLLTLTIEELLSPAAVEKKLKSFLEAPDSKNQQHENPMITNTNLIENMNTLLTENNNLIKNLNREILLGENSKGGLFMELESVINFELKSTNNLKDWPCPSFWNVGSSKGDVTKLSPIVRQLAQDLSPNCTAEYTKCFVQRDKCESRGDAICKG